MLSLTKKKDMKEVERVWKVYMFVEGGSSSPSCVSLWNSVFCFALSLVCIACDPRSSMSILPPVGCGCDFPSVVALN